MGHTDNIEQRISEHQSKKYGGYTAERCPVELVFHQQAESRDEAFAFEKKIKGWSRKKKEALMRGNWEKVMKLAKKKFE